MKIGFDLDDVLVDFIPSFLGFYNQRYGKNIQIEDIVTFDLWETGIGKNKEEAVSFVREFYESPEFVLIPCIKGAKEAVDELSRKNDLFVITSRNSRFKEKTEKYVLENLAKIPIIYSGGNHTPGKPKGEICRELNIEIFVEDCLDYAVECSMDVKKVLLFDKPWNQTDVHRRVIRVRNWREILEKIK